LSRDSTAEELAGYLEISPDKLERMQKNAEIRTVMSMEHGDDESMRLGDVIPGKQRNPHEEMLCMEKKTMVLHQLKSLPEREERIVEMHYFKGVSFQLISKEFGVSEARISQIHSSIKSKLHRKLSPVLEA
jgi:RNA polymerase sigma factor (sigma-70 family)